MTLKELWSYVGAELIRVTCKDGSVYEGASIDVVDKYEDEDIADGAESLTIHNENGYFGIYNSDISAIEVIKA